MWNKICEILSNFVKLVFWSIVVIFAFLLTTVMILITLSPYILAIVLTIFLISLIL